MINKHYNYHPDLNITYGTGEGHSSGYVVRHYDSVRPTYCGGVSTFYQEGECSNWCIPYDSWTYSTDGLATDWSSINISYVEVG